MATVEKKIKVTTKTVTVEEDEFVLRLSAEEAGTLKTLVGKTNYGSPLQSLWRALDGAKAYTDKWKVSVDVTGTITIKPQD